MKIVSQLDQDEYLIGATEADESPLEPGVFLLPAGARDVAPPTVPPGQRARLVGDDFIFEDIPVPVPEEPGPPMSADQVWQRIKEKRDIVKASGVKVGTKWYHTDTDSRIQHLVLKDQARDLVAAGLPDTARLQKLGQDVRWKTMDGSFIYLTVKHAFDIVAAVGDLDAAAFAVAETHRTAMESSADPAFYDFSGDWPEIFETGG